MQQQQQQHAAQAMQSSLQQCGLVTGCDCQDKLQQYNIT
jgi:hypothetical protein